MSILVGDDALRDRSVVARGPLSGLAASLASDLDRALAGTLYFPNQKARLSRDGGRCVRDGALLLFDPARPTEHECPECGELYRGDAHDRFWIYWYQLWLAERAVQCAVLSRLGAGDTYAIHAAHILDGYAERYARYPNVDNVLGPSRLFFSTYLESIWLLQVCLAADLLGVRDAALVERVKDRIVEPSRALIAQFDEGGSNRQVWNDVALLAAGRLVGDEAAVESAVFRGSGIVSQLSNGLLPDGTWYEGENYHLFAHRGLWYGVAMAEHAGLALPADLVARFERGFVAPFATALPDFTLPSRRDSQYAISLRQWRIAEHCELGLARRDDETLIGALGRMYGDDVPRRPTGRECSAAEVERNTRGGALSRADLSWRALLFARAELPVTSPQSPQSALLESQGIAVFRRDEGRLYVALDYGHSGGGHGHPDRLNLLIADGATRWLDDFGTGSYVDPSLHWYRSTLAHNAPLADGQSQRRVHGELLAYDEQEGAGWIVAAADDIAPGVSVSRALVVMPTYVVDCMTWEADHEATVDLPIHAPVTLADNAIKTAPMAGRDGREDGFHFLRETAVQVAAAGAAVQGSATIGEHRLEVFANASTATEWWAATAPGAPGTGDHTFRIVRMRAPSGEHRSVWSMRGDVASVEWADTIRVTLADGAVHEHHSSRSGWTVDVVDGEAIELEGVIERRAPTLAAPAIQRPPDATLPSFGRAIYFDLGERHYRRSEQTWREAGEPTATIVLSWQRRGLEMVIDVPRSDRTFAVRDAVNPYDNEPADINGDGVELFVRAAKGLAAWLLVPEVGSNVVRVRRIEGWNAPQDIEARWERSSTGYRIFVTLPGDTPPFAIDVAVNERPQSRERRRGQLVMSGAAGEFVYLRGDRHEAERLITLRISDD